MRIIEGKNVDLINPFPLKEVKRTYGWNHCYRTLTETDDTPNTQEHFLSFMEGVLQVCPSWGIIDKNHLTSLKHEAPIVGIIIFEPCVVPGTTVIRNGYFHVATARKAWRTGLVDEAGRLALREVFSEIPTLLRVSGYMLEANFPARSLCKRLGFKYEGLVEDMFLRDGEPKNMVLFGLTRREFNLCHNSSEDYLGQTQKLQTPTSLEQQQIMPQPLDKQTPPTNQTQPEVQVILEPQVNLELEEVNPLQPPIPISPIGTIPSFEG
jgi:RimJ/RimL family protein N-acetyltransferase